MMLDLRTVFGDGQGVADAAGGYGPAGGVESVGGGQALDHAALEVPDGGQPLLFTPETLDGLPEWADASRWRPTSTGGLVRADLDEAAAPRWDDLDGGLPQPCPTCGSLEIWIDGTGRRRCGGCDRAALEKARKLADLAADLRRRNPPRPKPADAEPGRPAAEPPTPQAARGKVSVTQKPLR